MKFKYYFSCIISLIVIPVLSQTININSKWEFIRLDNEKKVVEIKNQGSDWNSQFNIQHVEGVNNVLAVNPDTIAKEFKLTSGIKWDTVNLPHTPFIEPLVVLSQWQGVCYYRKQLTIEEKYKGKHIWIEFEGAMHLADLWINGKHVAQHSGGYTPFVADITNFINIGDKNELLVRLDNRNNPIIPPGKPLETLDFCYYGGLYRDVKIIVKDDIHITHPIMANVVAGGGIFVTYPKVSEKEAIVEVKTHLSNTSGNEKQITVKHTIYEWSKEKGCGKKIISNKDNIILYPGETSHQIQRVVVNSPRLWHPNSPNLYLLCTELFDGKRKCDCEYNRIGIRSIEITKEKGFVINGKPLKLEGTNRHQEYPYVGNAISNHAQYRDMYQIRNNGFNVVRLGHYPQDPSVLDACDELGLLAIEPIPGWQFYNKDQKFIDNTYRDIRDMVRRDRNHPSVIMWETTLNESWPPKEWKDGAVRVCHEEYPGNQCYTSGDSYGYSGFDVCYNDWEENFNRPNKTDKPAFIREYYDYEFGGHYSTTRVSRGDGDNALVQNAWNAQWSHNRYRSYYPNTIGGAVWSMYDYNRGCCDNICYSGVADIFRLPKFSLKYFRLQTPEGSYTPNGKMPYEVFINTHWLENSSDTVVVYGNVDEVELKLNGRVLSRKKADNGRTTDNYVLRPDGGNATNINFPPFTFFDINWESGVLEAVGYKNGKAVAYYSVKTPGKLHYIDISYFKSGVVASRNDLLIVYVNLKDIDGTLCFGESTRDVCLNVLNGGELRCPSKVKAEAGVASFVVATSDDKTLELQAVCGNLTCVKKFKLK